MEAAALTPAATPIRQRRRPGAHRRHQAANTTRAYRSGWATWQRWAAEHAASRPCQPRRQQAPLSSAWHAQRSAHGTARAPTTIRASIRAWCRYSRACRAAAGAAVRCRASIGAPPISPGVAAAGGVSGHSLRVGSAQSHVAAGAGLVELQEAGDWQTPTMPAHSHGTSLQHAALSPSSATRRGPVAAPRRSVNSARAAVSGLAHVWWYPDRGTPPG